MDFDLINHSEATCLFSASNLSAILLNYDSGGRIDISLKIFTRDKSTAWLVWHSGDLADCNVLRPVSELDLITDITIYKEEIDPIDKNKCAVFYHYERLRYSFKFEIIPISADGVRELQAFEFILGQYTIVNDIRLKLNSKNESNMNSNSFEYKPNLVARGLEQSGALLRTALGTGGRLTGHAIRYLGKTYTGVVVASSGAGSAEGSSMPPVECSHQEIAKSAGKAELRKEWAEGVHGAATDITSTAMFPVRWTGRIASQLGKGGSDVSVDKEESGPVTRAVIDTVSGLGNGVMHICKGVTEALSEVGSAIGDSAMHHAVVVHGEEYATQVTKNYIDAAGELGLAGYKVVNVATLGLTGVVINAMCEGAVYSFALYDFLVGPVLLQTYMYMVQKPLKKLRKYFVVLRPWSISFYITAADISLKPYKIVATSLLDTLPKLRHKRLKVTRSGYGPLPVEELEVCGDGEGEDENDTRRAHRPSPVSEIEMTCLSRPLADLVPVSSTVHEEIVTAVSDAPSTVDKEDGAGLVTILDPQNAGSVAVDSSPIEKEAETIQTQGVEGDAVLIPPPIAAQSVVAADSPPAVDGSADDSLDSSSDMMHFYHLDTIVQESGAIEAGLAPAAVMEDMQSCIELCTVDCSVYLLYPPEAEIDDWFHELSLAATRVETIAKRKSGAEEMALARRLAIIHAMD